MEIAGYTRFEKARILGARSLQIAMGAPPLLEDPLSAIDPMTIAIKEFDRRLIPITTKRVTDDHN